MKVIPHSRPTLGREEIDTVAETIASSHIAQGSMVCRFEDAVARYLGLRGGVAVSSGTAALHLALLALDIGEGDEVIIPDYTCTALLNAVFYTGARPVIADIIPHEYNIDPDDIKKKLTKKTKAIVVVHSFGLPARIDEILDLGVPVIEDIAHSIGAEHRGSRIGSFGSLCVASFYATKMMTTGEGGMVLSNSLSLLERIRDLRDYDAKDDYRVRYNYKMTDIEASIGLVQLKRLPSMIKVRKEIANYYNNRLKGLPISLPEYGGVDHVFFRYIVETEIDASTLIDRLKGYGIDAKKPVYKPLHRYVDGNACMNSLSAWERAVSLPVYPHMGEDERVRITEAMRSLLS